jgi:GxxExxY protein
LKDLPSTRKAGPFFLRRSKVGATRRFGATESNTQTQTYTDTSDERGTFGITVTINLREAEHSGTIIRLFYRIVDRLGFGFVESVYTSAYAVELTRNGIPFRREAPIDVWYDGARVGAFRADFIVANRVIVEIKACEVLNEAHKKQLLNYLRSSQIEVGLLLHFGPKPAFHRFLYTNDRKPVVSQKRC